MRLIHVNQLGVTLFPCVPVTLFLCVPSTYRQRLKWWTKPLSTHLVIPLHKSQERYNQNMLFSSRSWICVTVFYIGIIARIAWIYMLMIFSSCDHVDSGRMSGIEYQQRPCALAQGTTWSTGMCTAQKPVAESAWALRSGAVAPGHAGKRPAQWRSGRCLHWQASCWKSPPLPFLFRNRKKKEKFIFMKAIPCHRNPAGEPAKSRRYNPAANPSAKESFVSARSTGTEERLCQRIEDFQRLLQWRPSLEKTGLRRGRVGLPRC